MNTIARNSSLAPSAPMRPAGIMTVRHLRSAVACVVMALMSGGGIGCASADGSPDGSEATPGDGDEGGTSQTSEAETVGAYLQCSMHGNVFSVHALKDCYDGAVTARSLRDNSIYWRVDVYKARLHYRKQTWSQFLSACSANLICSAVSSALILKYTGPLRGLWIWLKTAG